MRKRHKRRWPHREHGGLILMKLVAKKKKERYRCGAIIYEAPHRLRIVEPGGVGRVLTWPEIVKRFARHGETAHLSCCAEYAGGKPSGAAGAPGWRHCPAHFGQCRAIPDAPFLRQNKTPLTRIMARLSNPCRRVTSRVD